MKSTIYILIIVSILFNNTLLSQENKGIHQIDKETFGLGLKEPSFFDPDGKDIIPLNTSKTNNLSHTIFGYLPDWEYSYRSYLRYDLVTHIGCFDFAVASNGNITNPSYWPWTDIINAAHSNGVKVIMVVVNFNSSDQRNIITNSTVKQNFFNNVKTTIQNYNLDGINVDFESLYTSIRGDTLNWFMADLTNYIHTNLPGKEVSFAGPAVNWGGWKFVDLANSCDYIFIMGYAFNGSWSTKTAPNSPLLGTNYCITNTIETQYGAVTNTKPDKLILGLPYYGYHWKTATPNEGSTVIESISSTRFKNDEANIQTYGLQWSTKYSNSWYRWNDGEWHQIWYDNDSSLGLKYDLAINKNLLGVGMWALCYDGNRQELWNLIYDKFNNTNYINSTEKHSPENFTLLPNYPNPFNPSTKICFNLNEPGEITVEIFSSLGTLEKSIEKKYSVPGQYQIEWNGKNHYEENISAGCYIYRVKFLNSAGTTNQKSGKMIFLK